MLNCMIYTAHCLIDFIMDGYCSKLKSNYRVIILNYYKKVMYTCPPFPTFLEASSRCCQAQLEERQGHAGVDGEGDAGGRWEVVL